MATVPSDPFRRLFDYIVALHISWQTYHELFGHSEERIKKLNRRTGYVFRVLQDALLEDVQLEIAKLFDRASMMGHETLTFSGILRDMPLPDGHAKRVQLKKDFDALKLKCDPIIKHRHRRLAHNDKAIAMDQEALPGISRLMIGEAVREIGQFYSDISVALYETEVAFRVIDVREPVTTLMRVVDAGNEKLDADAAIRRAKYKEQFGADLPEDFDPPEV